MKCTQDHNEHGRFRMKSEHLVEPQTSTSKKPEKAEISDAEFRRRLKNISEWREKHFPEWREKHLGNLTSHHDQSAGQISLTADEY